MIKSVVFIVMIAFISCTGANAHRQPGSDKPVVFALDATALAANKNKIKANSDLIMPAYKQLMRDANEALKFGPVSVMEKKK